MQLVHVPAPRRETIDAVTGSAVRLRHSQRSGPHNENGREQLARFQPFEDRAVSQVPVVDCAETPTTLDANLESRVLLASV
jgi:hypothetical protein